VAHRIQVTADKVRDAQPDNKYGWGLINPAASVTKVLPEEAVPDSGKRKAVEFSDTSKDRSGLLLILALVATAAAVLMVLRIRKLLLDNDSNDDENDDDTGEGQPNLFTPRRPDANGSHDPPPPPPPGQIMVPPSSPVANQSAAADSAEVRPFQRPVEAAPVATAPLPKRPVAGSDAGAAAESVEAGQKTEKVTETR
jgi:membrane-anchored mycosin MYCP